MANIEKLASQRSMREDFQITAVKWGVNRLTLPKGLVVAAAFTWLGINCPAVLSAELDWNSAKKESCLNELVDVYLSPLLREEGPPIQIVLKPGPPPVHLRLPRRWLRIDLLPNIYANPKDCNQKAFYGWRVSYVRASILASELGIPYDQPRAQDGQLYFYSLDPAPALTLPRPPPPVDDSNDRQATAEKGSWIIDHNYRGPTQHARFCVDQAQESLCYASVHGSMIYNTGLTSMDAEAFFSSTFDTPSSPLIKQITLADLDRYFTFLRRIADVVVVTQIPQAR